jgi:hypothetical protein
MSNSNFLSKSSPRSPDLEYVKMEAGMYGAQIERTGMGIGRGRLLGDDLHPLNIKVQTEIAITPESESNTAESMRGQHL